VTKFTGKPAARGPGENRLVTFGDVRTENDYGDDYG